VVSKEGYVQDLWVHLWQKLRLLKDL
jgi:hypothetical protein